jgi:hypothetical protein
LFYIIVVNLIKLFRELGRDYVELTDGTTVFMEPVNTQARGYVIQRSQGKTLNKKRQEEASRGKNY